MRDRLLIRRLAGHDRVDHDWVDRVGRVRRDETIGRLVEAGRPTGSGRRWRHSWTESRSKWFDGLRVSSTFFRFDSGQFSPRLLLFGRRRHVRRLAVEWIHAKCWMNTRSASRAGYWRQTSSGIGRQLFRHFLALQFHVQQRW